MNRFTWLIALFALASCASYEARPVDPADMAKQSNDLDWDDTQTRIALERLKNTRLFDSDEVVFSPEDGLNFEETFVAALAMSPLLKRRREEIKGRESMLLSVSGISSIRLTGNDDGPSDARRGKVGLLFDVWSLFGTGKYSAAYDQAIAQISKSVARLHESEWKLFCELKAGFLEVERIQAENKAITKLRNEFKAGIHSIANSLHSAGRISELDWNGVRVVDDRLTIHMEELRTRRETAVNHLKEIVGLRPEHEVEFIVSGTGPESSAWNEEEIRTSAIDRRWDLQILLAEYEAIEQKVRYEVATQYPDLRIGPLFRFGSWGSVFGGALSLDLPDPGSASARIDAADAERSMSRHLIEERLLTIQHQIRNNLLALRQKTSTASTWKNRTLTRVAETSEISRSILKLKPDAIGVVVHSFVDLFNATEEYWKQEQDRRDALIGLERAAGYPLFQLD